MSTSCICRVNCNILPGSARGHNYVDARPAKTGLPESKGGKRRYWGTHGWTGHDDVSTAR